MKTAQALTTLEELGSSQWGLVTAAQAQAHGVSRVTLTRLRDAGMAHPIRRGVYAMPSSGHGPLQEMRAAWLATNPEVLAEDRAADGDEVVVSHRSAAVVHGLGDLMPTRHEFTSTGRHTSSHADVTFHRQPLTMEDLTIVDGLLVTSIERTVADLAGPGVDLDHLAEVVRDSLAREDVDVRRLANVLTRAAKRHGFRDGEALIEACLERVGAPAPVLNTLPHLWNPLLIKNITAAAPQIDVATLWPAHHVAALSRTQLRQIQDSIDQLTRESIRHATTELVRQIGPPPLPDKIGSEHLPRRRRTSEKPGRGDAV